MTRVLAAIATACSLLWAVTGVSVLAIAYHEYHHHGEEIHNHDATFELVLHCHGGDGAPHHDHELTAPLNASRSSWSGDLHSAVSQTNGLIDAESMAVRASVRGHLESRNLGPPVFLLHCVLLT